MTAGIELMAPLTSPALDTGLRGWYVLAAATDVPARGILQAMLAGEHRLVYRGASGCAYVVDPYCPRRGCPLIDGNVVDEGLRCAVDELLWCPEGATGDVGVLKTHPVVETAGLVLTAVGPTESTAPVDVTGAVRRASARAHPHAVLECLAAPEILGRLLGLTIQCRSAMVDADGALCLDFEICSAAGGRPARVRAGDPGWATITLPGAAAALVAATPTANGLEVYLVGEGPAAAMLDELVCIAEAMTRLDRSSLTGSAAEKWALVRRWAQVGAR